MKLKQKAGFTLIELLVVVLIIGVLTAVAVPQYRKAVLKSRFSALLPLAKSVWEGNEIYYLNNGEYATDINELDVSAPTDPNVRVAFKQSAIADEESHQYVQVSNPNIPNRVTMYQKNSPNFAGETHCEALLDDDLANWLCKDSLQGNFLGNKYGYAVYSLSPESVGTLARTYHFPAYRANVSDGDRCADCHNGTFDNGAWCIGDGCQYGNYTNDSVGLNSGWHSTYNHSYCIGNAAWSCNSSNFTNHSVCYANSSGTCRFSYGGGYDETSCCTGAYCQNEADTCTYKGITPPPQPTYP